MPLGGARFCVAFSGGGDSTALLAALAAIRARGRFSLRALHVDHALHPASADWSRQARARAGALGVPCRALRAPVSVARGESLEARARMVRYAALAAALEPDEWLVTAHHAEDQAETLLLQLLRGAGVAGLSAMPAVGALFGMRLLRPVLDCGREQLRVYARRRGLPWLEDPSNADERLDRNYLRARVMPALLERWPGAVRTLGRSAAHLAQARSQLEAGAGRLLAQARDGRALQLAILRRWAPEQRPGVIRAWLLSLDAPLPDSSRLRELCAQMFNARTDSTPAVGWSGVHVRRHGDRLHLVHDVRPQARSLVHWDWQREPRLTLADGSMLWLQAHDFGALALRELPARLQVEVGAASRSRVAKRLQQAGVAAWERASVPLIFGAERLIAAGDLWIEAPYRSLHGAQDITPQGGGARAHLRWLRGPLERVSR